MPTLEQHKSKYSQNRALLDNELNILSCINYDWIITVSFYSALHLVEGELAKSNIHMKTHTDRAVMVGRNRAFDKIRSKYKMLHDRSIAARYGASSSKKGKALQSLQLLADIENEIIL